MGYQAESPPNKVYGQVIHIDIKRPLLLVNGAQPEISVTRGLIKAPKEPTKALILSTNKIFPNESQIKRLQVSDKSYGYGHTELLLTFGHMQNESPTSSLKCTFIT